MTVVMKILYIITHSYIFSHLSGQKQSVKINNCYSIFQLKLLGIPQWSILGPMLFNIFINDLILFIKQANLHNYADGNTITYSSKSLSNLKITLENESAEAINWSEQNNMLLNPNKIQVLFLPRKKELNTSDINLNFNNNNIISSNWVKLRGIKIDSRLNFEPHVSDLYKSAARQLNVLIRLKSYLTFGARKILIESFVHSSFNYCPLEFLRVQKQLIKWRVYKKEC